MNNQEYCIVQGLACMNKDTFWLFVTFWLQEQIKQVLMKVIHNYIYWLKKNNTKLYSSFWHSAKYTLKNWIYMYNVYVYFYIYIVCTSLTHTRVHVKSMNTHIYAKLSKKMECLICGCIVPVKSVCLRNGCLYSQYDLPWNRNIYCLPKLTIYGTFVLITSQRTDNHTL